MNGTTQATEQSADARAVLARALERAALEQAPVVVQLPAPVGEAESLLSVFEHEPAFFWDAPGEPTWVGVGAQAVLRGAGVERIGALRGPVARVLEGLVTHGRVDVAPRLFGGVGFAPGACDDAVWSGFEEASFVLPRWSFVREARQASLLCVVRAEDVLARLVAEHDSVLRALRTPVAPRTFEALSVEHLDRRAWASLVEGALDAISAGALGKVVVSRRSKVGMSAPIDAARVLADLAGQPGAVRFAVRRGAATFLGATPERLITRRGPRVDTMALAGSIRADLPDASDLLRASAKDQDEHAYVVRAILEALTPRCTGVVAAVEPEIRTLPHVLHLCTPIRGVLREGVSALDLVEAMHPTPAVGGTPKREAAEWVTAHEPAVRGWYASPVGWLDARGDADFVVALRSGVVRRDEAFVYAGAGIVRGSRAESEHAETMVKLQTFLGALGAVP